MSGYAAEGEGDRLLLSRVGDAVQCARLRGRPKFIGFLDPRERELCRKALKAEGYADFMFWGGYAQAERAFLGVFPGPEERDTAQFPLSVVQFTWKFKELSHRDFLGSLISLGIERGRIGDIIVGDESCVVVLDRSVAPFVLENLVKVGGAGVRGAGYAKAVERNDEFSPIKATVASPRLDAVVSALTGVSRGDAVKLIENGSVSVDFTAVLHTTQKVNEKSTVSVRGYGRFIIDGIGPQTRKGRLAFFAKKYR